MFTPLELFIGQRYTHSRRRNRFISFISFASMLGIMLGVMVLITVLSIMNGFEKELRGADYTGTHTVTDGNIITAKGAGCAIEFGHAIVSLAVSKDAADKVIGDMQCL